MKKSLNFILKLALQAIIIGTASYLLAYQLRFEFNFTNQVPPRAVYVGLITLLICRITSYSYFQIHKIYWRYFALKDFSKLLSSHLFSSISFTALVLLFRLPEFPRSIIFIEFMISLLAATSIVLLSRFRHESSLSHEARTNIRSKALIIGAGDAGQLIAKTLTSNINSKIEPIAILDDDKRTHSTRIHGIEVLGGINLLENLLISRSEINIIYFAALSIPPESLKQIRNLCNKYNKNIKIFRNFEDTFLNSILEDYNPEILVKRNNDQTNEEHFNKYRDKVVLITGAGGTIGSEICRQILSHSPKSLILIDNSEYNLYKLELELTKLKERTTLQFLLRDIRDINSLKNSLSDYKIDFVFHAAACKHVPICENNPHEAFLTNIIGTYNILNVAQSLSISNFTLISTDKAVEPINILGHTKKVAEEILRSLHSTSKTTLSIVRFGNVVNSTGSVIPLFREQIQNGGPVTVTDEKVKRYFMSTSEAAKLTLVASLLAKKCETFIFDMEKEIYLKDVAQEMIKFYDKDNIKIKYTGLRAGEKISEKLISENENIEEAGFPKIKRITNQLETNNQLIEDIKIINKSLYQLSQKELSIKISNLAK